MTKCFKWKVVSLTRVCAEAISQIRWNFYWVKKKKCFFIHRLTIFIHPFFFVVHFLSFFAKWMKSAKVTLWLCILHSFLFKFFFLFIHFHAPYTHTYNLLNYMCALIYSLSSMKSQMPRWIIHEILKKKII